MDNNTQNYDNVIAAREETATELDLKIKAYANMAWANLIESCKCLKRMRDTKKYEELGYSTFGDYTEASLNIKERQAYTYISTYEKQGEAFLQSNADLGITKLSLLNAIPATERNEFVETHDLAGMSVAEVEKLVKENDGRAEQINLLNDEISAKDEEISEAEQRIHELETELEAANNKPTEVAVAEPDAETLNKIRTDAADAAAKEAEKSFKAEKKKLKEDFKAEKEKAIAEATEKANKELSELKEKISAANTAADEAAKRANELEKKLAISSSPEATKFTFFFDALNSDYQNIVDSISNLKKETPEIADKYAAAMQRYQIIIKEKFKAIGYDFDEAAQKTVTLKRYPDSQDTGACSECNSCCGIGDNFCSYCGSKIVGVDDWSNNNAR